MKKKKKRIKWRNGVAKSLECPAFKQKVIQNKKKRAKVFIDIETRGLDIFND